MTKIMASVERPHLHTVDLSEEGGSEPSGQDDASLQSMLDNIVQVSDEYVPPEQDTPLVSLQPEGGEPESPQAFYNLVVERCVDSLAMHGCHRSERHLNERAEEEQFALRMTDAIAACGPGIRAAVMAWWIEELDAPDPWKVWAPMFVFGSIDGPAGLDAAEEILAMLPNEAAREAEIAAQALLVAPHTGKVRWIHELLQAPHPVKRAIALELGARFGLVDLEALRVALTGDEPAVVTAAMRASRFFPRATKDDPNGLSDPHFAAIAAQLSSSDPYVAWTASRSLALHGSDEAYRRLHRDAGFRAVLGPRALELLVMFGNEHDVPLIQPMLNAENVGRRELIAVARFGQPKAWAFLVHFLADGDMADDAADALELLFGRLVEEDDRVNTTAWRDALGQAGFEEGMRYRFGEPWRPSMFLTAYDAGVLSQIEAQAWLDELVTRRAFANAIDLALWTTDVDAAVGAQRKAIEQLDRGFTPGSWHR